MGIGGYEWAGLPHPPSLAAGTARGGRESGRTERPEQSPIAVPDAGLPVPGGRAQDRGQAVLAHGDRVGIPSRRPAGERAGDEPGGRPRPMSGLLVRADRRHPLRPAHPHRGVAARPGRRARRPGWLLYHGWVSHLAMPRMRPPGGATRPVGRPRPRPYSWVVPLLVLLACLIVGACLLLGLVYATLDHPRVGLAIFLGLYASLVAIPIAAVVAARWRMRRGSPAPDPASSSRGT
jgi:hypothetical protein